MRELINTSTRPQFNLALEEYILMNYQDEFFFLWQDEPAIIVGRNQNTVAEINENYVKEHEIQVVRRLTGGGAVYHDLGNLNFTLIVNDPGGVGFDFKRFTRPIIKALASVGIAAEYSGRNDLTIDGKKFSGNAQYRHRQRLLHHGTLLFASDMSVLAAALQVKPQKMASKGVKSVQSRVTNINNYAPGLTMKDFQKLVAQWLGLEYKADLAPYLLSEAEKNQVNRIADDKYSTWNWNYGNSPAWNLVRREYFEWGAVEVYLEVKGGLITGIKFFGDFFASDDLADLESELIGTRYEKQALVSKIDALDINRYLPQIDNGVFCKLIID